MQAFGRNQSLYEPGLGGVVSLEPQPFLHGSKAAPKSQWVTVKALWYRPSDGLEGLRLLWGRFEGKGAMSGRGSFPVASSPETTPPVRAQNIYVSCTEVPVEDSKQLSPRRSQRTQRKNMPSAIAAFSAVNETKAYYENIGESAC